MELKKGIKSGCLLAAHLGPSELFQFKTWHGGSKRNKFILVSMNHFQSFYLVPILHISVSIASFLHISHHICSAIPRKTDPTIAKSLEELTHNVKEELRGGQGRDDLYGSVPELHDIHEGVVGIGQTGDDVLLEAADGRQMILVLWKYE